MRYKAEPTNHKPVRYKMGNTDTIEMDKLRLRRIYGYQYFGSGSHEGKITTVNAESTLVRKNGFVSGRDGFVAIDKTKPAQVNCTGSDCINGGRVWREAYSWCPETQAWFGSNLASKE